MNYVIYVNINPFLRRNQVLEVAREISADATEKTDDDHIFKDEEVTDDEDEQGLASRLGKDESPT